ncbi:MAG TPA: Holliday junction resolvase RuvX [Gammaproteobacteria bacterium]|nr:Holliday junction resolvase RuvX [Gammaproteobacteria bacterium]
MTRSTDVNVLLAFDFGTRRIGVASANRITGTASPLEILTTAASLPWRRIDELVAEWQPHHLLVGMPSRESAPELAAAAGEFANALAERYGLPVSTIDETLTSRAARSELIMARRSGLRKKKIRKGSLDSHAACLIAEQWLNTR